MKQILKKAQDRYGYKNQIIVTSEELSELTQALLKYCRYPDHETAINETQMKVYEELADVIICIGHIEMIFDIKPFLLNEIKERKLERMRRWLETEEGFEQTTKDRKW